MNHLKWEAYLAIGRKIDTAGRGVDDSTLSPSDVALNAHFVDIFAAQLPPPARVLVPGGVAEAVVLAERGYEVHAAVLGPDNAAWLEARRASLPQPDLLCAREMDAHDLDYPPGFFDGYFSIQFHEHLLAPFVHIGEVRHCSRDGAIAFVDACGTTNPACKCAWHTNLVPEQQVLEQWEFWGWAERWRGGSGDERPQFVFEMLPADDSRFKNREALSHVMRLRRGERVPYTYNCSKCKPESR